MTKPKAAANPASIDTAEAFLVEFEGEPHLTDESREVKWFDYSSLREEEKIVGRDITTPGRTMLFALWGVSLASKPIYSGKLDQTLLRKIGVRGIQCNDFVLSKDDRYFAVVGKDNLRIWNNLSIAPEANEQGILPGGCLEELLVH